VRWLALAVGAVLVTVAFLAGGRVADTRAGLIYEVIALLAGLVGVSLVIYGWVAPAARPRAGSPSTAARSSQHVEIRSANDLLIGGAGLLIATGLLAGIGFSAGILWAALGLVLLLPMVVGCVFLCLRFLRASKREWKIDLQRLNQRGR
jgi:hypothetical protein